MLKNLTIKRFKQNSVFKHKALLALIILVLLNCLMACGKRKPPLPPVERVPQRVEVSGFQRGDGIILSWKMPARNAKTNNVENISSIDIYRLTEPLSAPLSLSEEDFASRSTLIKNFPVKPDDFGLKTMTYTDKLEFANQAVRLRYAMRFVNKSGQKAAFSNFLIIEPTARLAKAPTSLSTELAQEAIKLTWTAPTANIDGTVPVNILGYNVYRTDSKKASAKMLNKTPVKNTEYADKFFEFGKDYTYFVRVVSLGANSEPIESLESNIVDIKPKDAFAPSAPAAITVAAAPGNISIFYAVNPETDIAGYRIYRSTDPDLEKTKWEVLTPELLKANTYQDKAIESGKTYYYYITATDTAGNVSEISEVVSETAP